MKHLFRTYGAITPQTLTSAKAALETTTYNHAKPIANVFTAINEYANMADAANSAETPTQLINIGLIIITRSTLFASDIRKWHGKEAPEKTWTAFKHHFKEAQRNIKRSQPTVTTDSLGYHQVNAATIVDQVIERLTTEQMQHESEQQDAANATQQDGMIEQMQHLMATISDLQTQVTNNNNNRNNSNSNGNGNGSSINNGNNNGSGNGNNNNNNARGHNYGYQGRNNRGYQGRNSGYQGHNTGYQERGRGRGRSQGHERTGEVAQPRKYCWTHGYCAHAGTECNYKDNGHIDGATYTNRQGGSNYLCNDAGS
jgi:hypothetical protein